MPWIWNAQGIMGIKTPKTLKVQKVSRKILSQLHEAISEFFLLKASTIEFDLWNKSFIKQVQHRFKANNVKSLKVQKDFFFNPPWLLQVVKEMFLQEASTIELNFYETKVL